jgi:transposase, IS5 family
MSQPRDDRQDDLFRPALDKIINLRHPLVRLAAEIDWGFLAGRFGSVCRAGPGQPPLPTRLVAGLFILKHMHNLSDEMLCDRWVENPYFRVPRSWCVSAGITVLKMGAGLPEPACRGRLQTTPGCCV